MAGDALVGPLFTVILGVAFTVFETGELLASFDLNGVAGEENCDGRGGCKVAGTSERGAIICTEGVDTTSCCCNDESTADILRGFSFERMFVFAIPFVLLEEASALAAAVICSGMEAVGIVVSSGSASDIATALAATAENNSVTYATK